MSDTTIPAGEARSVQRSQITVEKDFNPRSELGGLDDLARSIAQHGILQPLLVRPAQDGSLVLVDGHRRLAAAAQAGLAQVPVLVRGDLDGQALVAAMVTALKRESLDPVEEAKAYGRLIAGGLTKKGAAEVVGVPQKTLTLRLAILEVPGQLHPAIAKGEIALSSVPVLVAMAKVSPALAELVGRTSPDRIDDWAAERAVSSQQGEHGLWPASQIDVERLGLDDAQRRQVDALSDQWSAWRPRFGEDELDRARAAGVLYSDNDDGYGYRSAVICDTDLVRELTAAALERDLAARQRRQAEQRARDGKPEPRQPAERAAKSRTQGRARARARARHPGPRGQSGPRAQAARPARRARVLQGPGRARGLHDPVTTRGGLLDRASRRRHLQRRRARRPRAALRATRLARRTAAQERHHQSDLHRGRADRPGAGLV